MLRILSQFARIAKVGVSASVLIAGVSAIDIAEAQKVVTPPSAPAPITRPAPPKIPGKPTPPTPVFPVPVVPGTPIACPINKDPVYSPISGWSCVTRPPAPSCRPGFMAIYNAAAARWICVKGTPVSN